MSDKADMPYVEATINETLRLSSTGKYYSLIKSNTFYMYKYILYNRYTILESITNRKLVLFLNVVIRQKIGLISMFAWDKRHQGTVSLNHLGGKLVYFVQRKALLNL